MPDDQRPAEPPVEPTRAAPRQAHARAEPRVVEPEPATPEQIALIKKHGIQ